MLTKRIIACLDVKDGVVVKGKRFENLVYGGDPVELGLKTKFRRTELKDGLYVDGDAAQQALPQDQIP